MSSLTDKILKTAFVRKMIAEFMSTRPRSSSFIPQESTIICNDERFDTVTYVINDAQYRVFEEFSVSSQGKTLEEMDIRAGCVNLSEPKEIKTFQIYLNLDGEFSSPYTYIKASVCVRVSETSVIADGVTINFNNEILGLSEKN